MGKEKVIYEYIVNDFYKKQIKSEMFITSVFSFKGKISRLEYFITIFLTSSFSRLVDLDQNNRALKILTNPLH